MDSDSTNHDHSEFGDGEASEDDGVDYVKQPHVIDEARNRKWNTTNSNSDRSNARTSTEPHEGRWDRLKGHYNDQYLDLLHQDSTESQTSSKGGLHATQIGSVFWSRLEKARFFDALSKKSKVDVCGIASSIGSKSEIEVYDYLRLLQEEDKNRHVFGEQGENADHVEIPAAAELSGECEAQLEKAADALVAYQDTFDHAVGNQQHNGLWLIDPSRAEAIDQEADDAELGNSNDDIQASYASIPGRGLFRLASWLSLTGRVFMNADLSQSENTWEAHAALDEMPAITRDAVTDFHELTLHQLRKVVQTALFCAESRIRNSKDYGYNTMALVRKQDVITAVGLLSMPESRSEFWIGLARKNKLRVVDRIQKDVPGYGTKLGYDEIERELMERPASRRGRRSAPRSSETSSNLAPSDTGTEADSGSASEISDTDKLKPHRYAEDQHYKKHHLTFHCSTSAIADLSSRESKNIDQDMKKFPVHFSQEECSPDDEDDEDRDLELFDQLNSRRVELQLYRDLGWGTPQDIKDSLQLLEKSNAAPAAAMTKRKASVDLQDWRESVTEYGESWENHGGPLSESSFLENDSWSKRRKVDQDSENQRELPFRSPPEEK